MNWVCSREAAQGVGEPADVGLVERRVDLVEHAERRRPDLEHREQEGDRGQRPLAAREHRQRLWLLAGRPGGDLDPGRRQVGRVGERQLGEAAAEQLLEAGVERDLEGRERRPELGGDQDVEVGDQRPRAADRVAQVAVLGLERLEAVADRPVLVDRERVGGAELVEPAPQHGEPAGRRRLDRRRFGGPARAPGRRAPPRARRPPPTRPRPPPARPRPPPARRRRAGLDPRPPRPGGGADLARSPPARRAPARAGSRG